MEELCFLPHADQPAAAEDCDGAVHRDGGAERSAQVSTHLTLASDASQQVSDSLDTGDEDGDEGSTFTAELLNLL